MESRISSPDTHDTVLMDLGDGLTLTVQVPPYAITRGEVSTRGSCRHPLSPDRAFDQIRALSRRLGEVLKEVQPTKASVTYGLELELRDGALLAALVHGGGKTSLEVTLEWERPSDG
jgi:hypothetical protein